MKPTEYLVTVECRKRGAMGIFYTKDFQVSSEVNSMSREQAVDAWLEHHGEEWELHHLISYKQVEVA